MLYLLKRKIDSSNQDRTNVEYIDSFYYSKFKNVEINKTSIN